MKKGNKKNSIVDRAKSNIVKNRKKNINRLNKIYDFLNTFEGRFTIIVFFTIIGFIVITANLYKIQIIQGNKWRAAGEEKYSSKNYIKAKRGKISTTDGQVLAYDNEDFIVTLDPTLIEEDNIDSVLNMLKRYIEPLEVENYKNEYLKSKKAKKQYLKIKHKISYSTKIAIEEQIDNDRKDAKIKSKKYKRKYKGVAFETSFTRNYVQNDAFQETLGFVNNENQGVYGIEKFYNKQLAGESGIIKGLRIPEAFLSIINIKNKENSSSGKDGNNLVLTLDSIMQYTLDEELKQTFEKYSADSAMGILMEVETGKILAMSSYPKAEDKANIKNRTITDYFEPGSIFKPITVSMGLQTKVINENSRISSSGSIRVQDRTIRDHSSSTIGNLNLTDIIAYSGNVAMVKISQMIDKNTFHKYLTDIGLGAKSGIDTYFESTKELPKLRDLTEVRKATISFGQGISMTQIQMLVALNTVVNNGKLMKPYLVDRIEDSNGKIVEQNKPIVIKKILSDEISRLSRRYMEAVVNYGTGKNAYISGYRVGGKTGTAQKSAIGGYTKGKYFSSFFAFFPADKPKYAMLITVNEPKGNYYGADVALPSVRHVLEKLIDYRKIETNGRIKKNTDDKKSDVVKEEKKKDLTKIKQDFDKNIMPDLTGISLREFLSIYPQGKFSQYEVKGSGKVIGQFPEKGIKLDKQSKIQIVLE